MLLYDFYRSSAAYRVRIALNLKGLAAAARRDGSGPRVPRRGTDNGRAPAPFGEDAVEKAADDLQR